MNEAVFHQRVIAKYERKLARIEKNEGRDMMLSNWMLICMLLQHERTLCALQGWEFSIGVHVPPLPAEHADVSCLARKGGRGIGGNLEISYDADRVQPHEWNSFPEDRIETLPKPRRACIRFRGVDHWDCADQPIAALDGERYKLVQCPLGFGGRQRRFQSERFNSFCYEIENSRELQRLRDAQASACDVLRHWRLWIGGWVIEVVGTHIVTPALPIPRS